MQQQVQNANKVLQNANKGIQNAGKVATRMIRKRIIKLGSIKRASINKNCPKFIVGHCWLAKKAQILSYCSADESVYLHESFDVVQRWIREDGRDSLNLNHLRTLFGRSHNEEQKVRKYYCAKAFYKFLSQNTLEIMMSNRKVAKILSYLICLQKFTARLGHPQLVYKLQFK